MLLLVLSDTHGNYPLALQVAEDSAADQIIHLGVEVADAEILESILARPVLKVAGNCDLDSLLPRELFLNLGGIPFLITHGDRYQTKTGLVPLRQRAAALGAQVVLYGHTHVAAVSEQDGILLVNPGALQPTVSSPSYALVTLAAGAVSAAIVPLDTSA
jgi:hypothetical protein